MVGRDQHVDCRYHEQREQRADREARGDHEAHAEARDGTGTRSKDQGI